MTSVLLWRLAQPADLLRRYRLNIVPVPLTRRIPGSYWGESETGLIGNRLYVRGDTPLHSLLHEACHYICMPASRRNALHTDAAGDYSEENGVCYLQILLSQYLSACGQGRMFRDMDSWGYSFRLGSTRAWFQHDAEDAKLWLFDHGLIDDASRPLWRLRQV